MPSRSIKRIGVLVSLVLTMSVLAACLGHNADNEARSSTSPDASRPPSAAPAGMDSSNMIELQFYMLGNEPKDLAKIEAEINKMAAEDLNATVKFNFTTWTNWDQKFKLLLSMGQSVDLIFTAEWTQYQQYAKRGAFLALDDLLPKVAPTLYEFVPEDMWDGVRIDGKIYTVPSTYKEYVTGGFVWREDLRAKYNLPKPVDMATFEAYLEGIKQNEPNIQPIAIGEAVDSNLQDTHLDIARNIVGPLPYGLFAPYDDPGNMSSYWGSPEHLEDLKLYRRWVEDGYMSQNELNVKETNQDRLVNGTAASMFGENPTRYNSTLNKMKSLHPDWDLGYHPYGLTKGYATPVHPIHNGFAIPASSKYPERALAFYEKLVTDKRYNQLTQYGIEGVHYEVENGYYKMLGNADTNGFIREAMNSWAWRNPEYMLFEPSYDQVAEIFEKLDQIQKPDIYTGFAEDYVDYQAERAALEQVEKQYLYPMLAGQISDVEQGLQTFIEKAKEAGLDKVQEAYTKQWLEYLEKNGIQ